MTDFPAITSYIGQIFVCVIEYLQQVELQKLNLHNTVKIPWKQPDKNLTYNTHQKYICARKDIN